MGRPPKLELDEVLKRTSNLLWQRGADAVSTRDLEAALDLRAPAIYRRFGSKDGLIAQTVAHYVDHIIVGRIERFLEADDDPLQGLHAFFTSTLSPYGREKQLRGCLLANTSTSATGQVPHVRAAIHRGWDLMIAAFRRQVERAQDGGQIDPDLDPEAVTLALLMSLQGLLTLVRAGGPDLRPGIDATFRILATDAHWNPPTDA